MTSLGSLTQIRPRQACIGNCISKISNKLPNNPSLQLLANTVHHRIHSLGLLEGQRKPHHLILLEKYILENTDFSYICSRLWHLNTELEFTQEKP